MTERLTDEAALAMARETAGKAYVSSISDICDEDREMWLYAYRAGRWKNSPSVQSALAAIRAIEDRLTAENARLRAALEDIRTRLTETPTMPSYLLGLVMAYIDDRARAALTDTGAV